MARLLRLTALYMAVNFIIRDEIGQAITAKKQSGPFLQRCFSHMNVCLGGMEMSERLGEHMGHVMTGGL